MPKVIAQVSGVALAITLVQGCATPTLAPGAGDVKLTQKAEDVAGCTAVGNITPSQDGKGGRTFSTPAEFKNQAIGLNGNTVFVTSQYMGAPVEGVVYRCTGTEGGRAQR
jgi:hypothetical protein